jgi:hypothetical protein
VFAALFRCLAVVRPDIGASLRLTCSWRLDASALGELGKRVKLRARSIRRAPGAASTFRSKLALHVVSVWINVNVCRSDTRISRVSIDP